MSNNKKHQVLVAAMHQTDGLLFEKMHLATDAVIGNQCDRCENEEYRFGEHTAYYYSRPSRGVGLNRNTTLLYAGEGIVTFADEDMVFADGYSDIIQKAFEEIPKADAIIFNIETIGADMGRRQNDRIKRLHFYNAMNYGAARVSARGDVLKRENLLFHTCFGGGTRYSAGEDTLFILGMLKKKMRVYVYPATIASVDQTSSTWFNGYNEKYFYDKGAVFAAVSRRWAKLLCLQEFLRHKSTYASSGIDFKSQYRLAKEGIKAFSALKAYGKNS